MSGHTKGKWKLSEFDDEWIVTENGTNTVGGEQVIAVTDAQLNLPVEERLANAKLISKAPEMLEALEKIVGVYLTSELHDPPEEDVMYEIAKQILKEIEGE